MNPTQNRRSPCAAGRFYAQDPAQLRRHVGELLAAAPKPVGPPPKALIVPHAGYMFSGSIAASAYACLAAAAATVRRVVLLGPAHFVALRGVAAASAEVWVTPLGAVPVDRAAVRQLAGLPQFACMDAAHAREHSLEVQLPFLQAVLGEFSLVPLVVGQATAEEIRQVLEQLWGGPETCLVISSDLSHYLDSAAARRLDQAAAEAIEDLAPDRLTDDQACGHLPIRGLLAAARYHHLRARTVDLRNSGDTAGPRDRVVGYGAFVFEAPARPGCPPV